MFVGFGRLGLGQSDHFAPVVSALALLSGEPEGLAIDFTCDDGRGAVAVKDFTTPANNRNNVPVDRWLTNAGTSPKLVKQEDGTYAWAPHNQCLQSEDISTTWSNTNSTETLAAEVAANGVSLSRITSTNSGGTGAMAIGQSFATVASAFYTSSIYLKAGTLSWVRISISGNASQLIQAWFDLSSGTIGATLGANNLGQGIESIGNGVYRCYVSWQADSSDTTTTLNILGADGNGDTQVALDGLTSFLAGGGQHNRGLTPTRYVRTTSAAVYSVPFEYDGGWYGLIEPAATNLCLQPSSWSHTNVVATSAFATSPTGATDAWRLQATAAVSTNTLFVATGAGSAAGNTYSIFVKKGNTSTNRFRLRNATTATTLVEITFNYDTEQITYNTGSSGASAVTLANGWYRLSLTASSGISASDNLWVYAGWTGQTVAAGDYLLVWVPQLETGLVPTSPIPTFGATVTRARDSLEAALTTLPSLSTMWTGYVDFVSMAVGGGAVLGLSETTATDDDERLYLGSTNLMRHRVVDEAAGQTDIDSTVVATAGARSQMAGRFVADDFAISANGGAVVKDTSGTKAGDMTMLRFGKVGSSSNLITSPTKLRRAVVVPRAVPDGELPTWRYAA